MQPIAMDRSESTVSAVCQHDAAVTRQLAILFLGLCLPFASPSQMVLGQEGLVAWWSFDDATVGRATIDHVRDRVGKLDDRVIGNTQPVKGVVKTAMKCDGFTSHVVRAAAAAPRVSNDRPAKRGAIAAVGAVLVAGTETTIQLPSVSGRQL